MTTDQEEGGNSCPFDRELFPKSEGWTFRQYRYGNILFRQDQTIQSLSLSRYGEYKEHELGLLRQILRPGDCVLETVANYGEQTIPLAQHVGLQGTVLAFEPNNKIRAGLTNNIRHNSLTNVMIHGDDLPGGSSLDGLLLRKCSLVKITGGHGNDILDSGRDLLLRLRPYLYVKNDQSISRSQEMNELLLSLGYSLWWHPVPLYNGENFNKEVENVFGNLATVNIVGAPKEINLNIKLPPVSQATDYWWRLFRS